MWLTFLPPVRFQGKGNMSKRKGSWRVVEKKYKKDLSDRYSSKKQRDMGMDKYTALGSINTLQICGAYGYKKMRYQTPFLQWGAKFSTSLAKPTFRGEEILKTLEISAAWSFIFRSTNHDTNKFKRDTTMGCRFEQETSLSTTLRNINNKSKQRLQCGGFHS